MGNNPGFPMPSWVCNKTFSELFKGLMDPPEKIVYAAGSIYKNGDVLLDSWYLGEGEPDLVDEGVYTMQCVSSTGDILYSTNFGKEVEDFLGFGFVIPYPEGTTSVLIKKGDQILREVQATRNAPTVKLQFPNGGETISSKSVVSWSGTDYDGDQLLYSVLCSQDGGGTWTALALELNGTSYDVDFSSFAEGNQYLIQVVVTDGFNTAQDVSDGIFTVGRSSSFTLTMLLIPIVVVLVVVAVILLVFVFKKKHNYLDQNMLPPPPPPPPSNIAVACALNGRARDTSPFSIPYKFMGLLNILCIFLPLIGAC